MTVLTTTGYTSSAVTPQKRQRTEKRESVVSARDTLRRRRSTPDSPEFRKTDTTLRRLPSALQLAASDSSENSQINADDSSTISSDKDYYSRIRPEHHNFVTDTVEDLLLPPVSDADEYMLQREMTVIQERWNAVTMMPGVLYCWNFLRTAAWVIPGSPQNDSYFDAQQDCWSTSSWSPSVPPACVLAVVAGVTLHAPFSILYHLQAPYLSAHERSIHWSRRLDQCMIHVASTFVGFATSGSYLYFALNILYTADCLYRQWLPKVQPRRNQIRLSVAVALAYLVPLVWRQWDIFVQLSILLAVAFVLFTRYPLGGWSHAAFHLILALTPPLLLQAAVSLESSQVALERGSFCWNHNQQLNFE